MDRKEFTRMTRPLVKYLNDKANPHAQIIITTTGAEMVHGVLAYETEEFLRGKCSDGCYDCSIVYPDIYKVCDYQQKADYLEEIERENPTWLLDK